MRCHPSADALCGPPPGRSHWPSTLSDLWGGALGGVGARCALSGLLSNVVSCRGPRTAAGGVARLLCSWLARSLSAGSAGVRLADSSSAGSLSAGSVGGVPVLLSSRLGQVLGVGWLASSSQAARGCWPGRVTLVQRRVHGQLRSGSRSGAKPCPPLRPLAGRSAKTCIIRVMHVLVNSRPLNSGVAVALRGTLLLIAGGGQLRSTLILAVRLQRLPYTGFGKPPRARGSQAGGRDQP